MGQSFFDKDTIVVLTSKNCGCDTCNREASICREAGAWSCEQTVVAVEGRRSVCFIEALRILLLRRFNGG